MLKNIKSLFILKKIFKHLQDYRLLKAIKYNKSIQNRLRINSYNYKIFKWKYIEYDTNGKGKEYSIYNGMFEFEGEYLNGLRNGKGKEYENRKFGKLLYEGEFLNGEKNGKGKEYDGKGKVIFEGEYLNGERNGKGKEYEMENFFGRYIKFLKFEGEYINGKRNGKGKEFWRNGKLIFEGEYLNGKQKISSIKYN